MDWLDRIERRHDLWRGAEPPGSGESIPSGEWMLENDLPALVAEVRRLRRALHLSEFSRGVPSVGVAW